VYFVSLPYFSVLFPSPSWVTMQFFHTNASNHTSLWTYALTRTRTHTNTLKCAHTHAHTHTHTHRSLTLQLKLAGSLGENITAHVRTQRECCRCVTHKAKKISQDYSEKQNFDHYLANTFSAVYQDSSLLLCFVSSLLV
jgi:hypothetical protein